jgi:F-type H+-transporting ATPase subunit b
MLIDWFTVVAQIFNFLILVGLLKYFLYGRVIKAMDQREARITSRLEEAEKRKREAEDEVTVYTRKNQEFDLSREQMFSSAKEEAESFRKELVQKAHEEVGALQARWHEAVLQGKKSFLQELGKRATREVFAVTRQALRDLADADLEQQMVEVFIRRIRDLDDGERQRIKESIDGTGTVVISSAFPVPEGAQQKIIEAVKDCIDGSDHINYQISVDVISGIELRTVGHKITWSLESYLSSLETAVLEAMEVETKTDQGPGEGGKAAKERTGSNDGRGDPGHS